MEGEGGKEPAVKKESREEERREREREWREKERWRNKAMPGESPFKIEQMQHTFESFSLKSDREGNKGHRILSRTGVHESLYLANIGGMGM
ncbi:hypothetical protein Taro_011406 [Colocasia esculenta]|uniref:Uncharacterized protein n=1 Tax=Colocasia esculenta TaxID=4460 RepID=A0A843U5R5_COLES|nr:hypothetical protein [Colocasia esculenta]